MTFNSKLYEPPSDLNHIRQLQAAATGCPNGAASDEDDWNNARPFKEIPGPSKYELVRSFLPGGAYHNKPMTYFMTDLRRKYGDFAIIPGVFGGKSIVMAFDPEAYKTIFRNEGTWPMRRIFDSAHYFRAVRRKEYFKGVEGLLLTSGESWGHFRTAVSPVLMNPKNSKQYLAKMLPVNDEFLQRIREIRDPTTLEVPDTFIDEIDILTFESIAVIALDPLFGLIRRNRDSPEAKTLFEAIKEFFELVYVLDVQPSMWKIIKTKKFHKMMNVSETILEITCQHIDAALERFQKNPHPKDDGYQRSIIEALVEQDKTIAVVTAMDLMLAGVDTTNTTITGILLGIAKNPEKQEKLRQEIRTILPQKDSMLTIENMANLPYLRACIKEGIRMYPIGPGSVRIMPMDIVIRDYQIPEGTLIAMGNNMILREDKYYPRPNEFIPERWLRTEERNAYKPDVVNPFVYLPFGFGPRSCVGKRIVQVELMLTVSRLVRNFYIEFNYSVENAFKTVFMSRPAIPLKFKFAEVEN